MPEVTIGTSAWVSAVLDALGDSDPEALALTWHFVCLDCGGGEHVPAQVQTAHRRAVDSLRPSELALYHAKFKEVEGNHGP
ncbi:MAG: hypothetical protein FJ100_23880 [Deltaproteobacteria bacterium]|nr:hypothetical protein [Deltaproteobacteria bacterium]